MTAVRAVLPLALVLSLAVPARPQPGGAPQWRAFWVDAFNPGIKTPEQVERLVADLKALHCNAVFAQVRRRGDAYFRKTVAPFTQDPDVPAGFDPLAHLLQEAHKAGLQVHAWINPLPIRRADDPPPRDPQHVYHQHGPGTAGRANWLTCDEKGAAKYPTGYFLDPGHPDVHEH